MALCTGAIVGIKTTNAEYNEQRWTIVAINTDRIHLTCDRYPEKTIAVKPANILPTGGQPVPGAVAGRRQADDGGAEGGEPLAVVVVDPHILPTELAITAAIPAMDLTPTLAVDEYIRNNVNANDVNQFLNIWHRLPRLGGNSILLERAETDGQRLVMFPELDRYRLRMWFYSALYKQMILLEPWDYIEKCPMDQMWPKCAWCRKFAWADHRASKQHQWAMHNYNCNGMEISRAQMALYYSRQL